MNVQIMISDEEIFMDGLNIESIKEKILKIIIHFDLKKRKEKKIIQSADVCSYY